MSTWRVETGDCLELLKTLGDGSVDAIITDPPYGIGFKYNSYDDSEDNWFRLMNDVVPELKRISRFVIMPACSQSRMQWWYHNHAPEWLVCWYKGSPGHRSRIGFNCWEAHVTWGRPSRAMHDYFQTRCGFEGGDNDHPCPKPVDWATRLVRMCTDEGMTVLDPFSGSGTTGVACMITNRNFIGYEKDPSYADIARRRIGEAASTLWTPPAPAAVQGEIFS